MSKWFGKIGFVELVETAPSVWQATDESIVEKSYKGDVSRKAVRWQNGQNLNNDLIVNNTISIVADDYIMDHYGYMKYIEWRGTLWEISDITIEYPRLIISLGGVYNGQTPSA